MEYKSEYDEEPIRSLSRLVYGHEIWIGSVERKDGKITFSGDYGHHMNHDRDFPEDYSLIKIIDGKGNEIKDYTMRCDGSARFITFDDPGDEIITVYFYSKPIPWTVDEEGWHKGPKKDFKNVKFSGGFNMIAKRVISKTGKVGDAKGVELEIYPCATRVPAGTKVKMQVLYEGKPQADVDMVAYRADAEDGIKGKTDKDGKWEVVLDRNGEYMLYANFKDESKAVKDMYDCAAYESTYTIVVF